MDKSFKSVIHFKSLFILTFRYLNAGKIIESIILLCNSIKKTKKRKMQTLQTYWFFFCVYIRSRQMDFVLRNKRATVFIKQKIQNMNFVVCN